MPTANSLIETFITTLQLKSLEAEEALEEAILESNDEQCSELYEYLKTLLSETSATYYFASGFTSYWLPTGNYTEIINFYTKASNLRHVSAKYWLARLYSDEEHLYEYKKDNFRLFIRHIA